jgi:hypothetical protein
MSTNEIQVTGRAIAALGNAIDDLLVASDINGNAPSPEELAHGALLALARDGWELKCGIAAHDESSTPAPELNVFDHVANQVAAHGD